MEKSEIIKLIDEGMSQSEIAKRLEISRQAIYNRLTYTSVRDKKDSKIINLYEAGLTPQQIATAIDYSCSGVKSALIRLNLPVRLKFKQNYRTEEIKELWKKGLTINEMVEETGVNQSYISKVLIRLKLPRHKPVNFKIAKYVVLKSKGHTDAEIAIQLGVHRQTIRNYAKEK